LPGNGSLIEILWTINVSDEAKAVAEPIQTPPAINLSRVNVV